MATYIPPRGRFALLRLIERGPQDADGFGYYADVAGLLLDEGLMEAQPGPPERYRITQKGLDFMHGRRERDGG